MGPPLAQGAAIMQSASTVTASSCQLGSSGSSCEPFLSERGSSRSEAEPYDESLIKRLMSEPVRRSSYATSPRSTAPTTPTQQTRTVTPPPPMLRSGVSTQSLPSRNRASTPRGGASPRTSRAGTPRQGTPRQRPAKENGEEGLWNEVKVCVRVRPPFEKGRPLSYFADEEDHTKLLCSVPEAGSNATGSTSKTSVAEFSFSRVISPLDNNRRAFAALGLQELIAGVCEGFQETIFAYGQTGSGKTHTILGSRGVDHLLDDHSGLHGQRVAEPGLLQLCTRELFNTFLHRSSSKSSRRCIQLVCLEIKNEDLVDLLPLGAGVGSTHGGSTPRSTPSGTTTPRGGARVVGAHSTQETLSIRGKRITYRKVTAWSYDETMWLLREAIASREVGASSLNSESSRSHMVIRFYLKTMPTLDSSAPSLGTSAGAVPMGVVGSLTLVDLAGNERESHACPTRKGEAKAINVSLTHLNRMLLKMQSGTLDDSDRRQGTLNMVLYESLREDCGVNMIFCLHPDRRFAVAARSTLEMARRCRRIVCRKRVRRLEASGSSQTELVDLRNEAQALCERLRSMEQEKKQQEDLLQKASLELRERRRSKDGQKHSQQDELELAASRLGRKSVGDEPRCQADLREIELARCRDVQVFQCQLQAYREELRSLKESHALEKLSSQRELRSLKDALHQQGIAAEATPPDSTGTGGEPCSEPSMQSSRAGFDDDEALMAYGDSPHGETTGRRTTGLSRAKEGGQQAASHVNLEHVASPQRHGHGTDDLDYQMCEKGSKVERVLGRLQHSLCQEGSDADIEAHLSQICRLAQQARIKSRDQGACLDLVFEAAWRHGASLRTRSHVVKLLHEMCSKDIERKEEMIERGALQFGIETLRFLLSMFPAADSETRDVCTTSFRLLGALCQHLGSRPRARVGLEAVLHSAVEVVLRCLEVPQLRDKLVISNGGYLIMTLVDKCPEHQELVRTSNGIPLLLRLLDTEVKVLENESASRPLDATRVVEQTSATLCQYVTGCLAKVVQDNPANQQALYEGRGIDVILRTLKACLYSGYVVGNACTALAFIVKGREQSQRDARLQGAVQHILDALHAYSGDSSVQVGVCRAIAVLTDKNDINQEAFLEARLPDGDGAETGAVALLLQALGRTVGKHEEEPLVTTMCWALSNLTRGNPAAMAHIRQLRGLNVVVSLLKRFEAEDRACEYLCLVLTELCRGSKTAAEKNREELQALGAEDAIMKMMHHHAKSEGFVLVRARDALQNLHRQEECRRSIVCPA